MDFCSGAECNATFAFFKRERPFCWIFALADGQGSVRR